MPYQDPPNWNNDSAPFLSDTNLDIISENQRDHESRIVAADAMALVRFENAWHFENNVYWGVTAAFTLKWDARLLVIPMPTEESTIAWFGITGTPASGVLDPFSVERASANGINIQGWESLWIHHTRGGNDSAGILFRITTLGHATEQTYFADPEWHLLGYLNGDSNVLHFTNGLKMSLGETVYGGGARQRINALEDVDTTTLAPSTGNVLKYSGTAWAPGTAAEASHTHSGLAPTGGATGEVLKKNSATAFDYSWGASGGLVGGAGWARTLITADVTNANATANTLADVTGLSFAVEAGKRYAFKFVIPYTAAAITTGSRWSINGPASPTLLNYTSRYTLTEVTETVNYESAYNLPSAANASSLAAGNLAVIEGVIIPSASGTVIARFASEVLSSAIVAKAGAYVQYTEITTLGSGGVSSKVHIPFSWSDADREIVVPVRSTTDLSTVDRWGVGSLAINVHRNQHVASRDDWTNTTDWTLAAGSTITRVGNDTAGPYAGTFGDKLTPGGAYHLVTQNMLSIGTLNGRTFRFGVYLKAAVAHTAQIEIADVPNYLLFVAKAVTVDTNWRFFYVDKTFTTGDTGIFIRIAPSVPATDYVWAHNAEVKEVVALPQTGLVDGDRIHAVATGVRDNLTANVYGTLV